MDDMLNFERQIIFTYFARGSINVWLTSCLTKLVGRLNCCSFNLCKEAESIQSKQEVNFQFTGLKLQIFQANGSRVFLSTSRGINFGCPDKIRITTFVKWSCSTLEINLII